MKALVVLLSIFSATFSFAAPTRKNPLLQKWTGPYGGVPPFDRVKVSDFKPAIEQGIAEHRKEIEAIVKNSAPPTFENTVLAMEKSGETLNRVWPAYGVWSGSLSTPAFQKVEQELAPVLAAYEDEIIQNAELYKRIDAVDKSDEKAKLNPEQKRLLWHEKTRFEMNGARLNEKDKKRVAEINQRLASLTTQFQQNELGDEEDDFLVLEKSADLEGLPKEIVDAASDEAKRRKMKGKWVIANTRSAMEPFMTYSAKRDLREKAFRIWAARGDQDNKHNNNKIVTEILQLRAERSKLLGYKTYAHWRLADTMAKDPKNAMDLMMKVWAPAVEQVKKEVADMQAIVDAEKGGFKIEPWDYRYYAEKVRKAKYDLNFDTVKPYLRLENIRKAMFLSAEKLFGFKFTPVKGIPVFNKNMSVYKVERDGKTVGLWYFDPYARPGKNSGAWMTSYREQHRMDGENILTLVSNNSNFIPGKPGQPVSLSWDDAVTMFHEFGHALHGLSSNVTYESLSGTNTTRDFVEFPSQMNENYIDTPEVMKLLVNKKGEPLPTELAEKITRAKTFNSGFTTVEFLASGILDMKLHLSTEKEIDPRKFEAETLKELGMPKEIIMRHRIPHFGHVFSGEGYAAGYYGYLWSQVLEYDAFEAFKEASGPYDPAVAKKYFDLVLSVGNTQDPAENFRKFRGRDPSANALLRARGFPVPKN